MPIVAARGSREMRKERSGEKDIEIGGERERERERNVRAKPGRDTC